MIKQLISIAGILSLTLGFNGAIAAANQVSEPKCFNLTIENNTRIFVKVTYTDIQSCQQKTVFNRLVGWNAPRQFSVKQGTLVKIISPSTRDHREILRFYMPDKDSKVVCTKGKPSNYRNVICQDQ